MLTDGADPPVVDDTGNNVLMSAVLIDKDSKITDLLAENIALANRLVTQKNKAGHGVLALFLLSGHGLGLNCNGSLMHLIRLGAYLTSTDKTTIIVFIILFGAKVLRSHLIWAC